MASKPQPGGKVRNHPDAALARVAARQHGVVTSAQLASVGLNHAAVSKRTKAGRLHPLYRGVYGVGHRKLSREGQWMAAVLACGDGAVLSHLSAATLWQSWRRRTVGIDVVAPGQRRPRPGIKLRRARHLDPRDVTTYNGIPVTTLPRTLVDLTDVLTAEQLANVIHEAEFHGRFNLRATHRAMSRANGRRLRVLRAALAYQAAGSAGTKSGLEDRFLALIRRAGLPEPLPNVVVEAAGGQIQVDAYWPELRLCVEIDGPGHERPRTQQEDNARDRALEAAGLRILRFTEHDIDHRPTATTTALGRECATHLNGSSAAPDQARATRLDGATGAVEPRDQARQALSQNATSCSTDVRKAACIAA